MTNLTQRIPGFSSIYWKFNKKYIPEPNTGCWLWIGSTNNSGYGRFGMNKKQYEAHRAAYILFVGDIPYNKVVAHTCDVRCCVNPQHLKLSTQSDNIKKAYRTGNKEPRLQRGELNNKARLTKKQVLKIKKAVKRNAKSLAREFGVSRSTIYDIRNGRTWTHLMDPDKEEDSGT